MTAKAHSKDFFLTIWLGIIVDRLTAQNEPPSTALCREIISLGTNDTWTKCNFLSSGRFLFLLLFCHNSRLKFKFQSQI